MLSRQPHNHLEPYRNCKECGDIYKADRYTQQFCKTKCKEINRNRRRRLQDPHFNDKYYQAFLQRNPGYRKQKYNEWVKTHRERYLAFQRKNKYKSSLLGGAD